MSGLTVKSVAALTIEDEVVTVQARRLLRAKRVVWSRFVMKAHNSLKVWTSRWLLSCQLPLWKEDRQLLIPITICPAGYACCGDGQSSVRLPSKSPTADETTPVRSYEFTIAMVHQSELTDAIELSLTLS